VLHPSTGTLGSNFALGWLIVMRRKREYRRNRRTPLLGEGGVAAPINKMSRSHFSGRRRAGEARKPDRAQPSRNGSFNHRLLLEFVRTTPSAPFKGTGPFFDGAATPPLPRRGIFAAETSRPSVQPRGGGL